ncbi:hypothetical protein SAMN05421827_102201 [Pedobacter terrae]|uniref:Uncharacterized protein n=1 Tax=Pedobacter terrae TaxID=405671 RepID=A0A1G7Q8N0_9SPHI|nr:hypothetical protein [Pedobacter terrae]SDF94309.1 hypothetical protein SAMN05421827_102201 [Pedobacter terrae]
MTNEIQGTYAQVHPKLDDPVGRQGQIGMITYADLERDDVYINFEKGQQALYSSNALLVMRKSNEIYRDTISKVSELSTADFKMLLEISMKMQSSNLQEHRAALEMSLTNETTRQFSQISLQERLGVTNNYQLEQEQVHTRGR